MADDRREASWSCGGTGEAVRTSGGRAVVATGRSAIRVVWGLRNAGSVPADLTSGSEAEAVIAVWERAAVRA